MKIGAAQSGSLDGYLHLTLLRQGCRSGFLWLLTLLLPILGESPHQSQILGTVEHQRFNTVNRSHFVVLGGVLVFSLAYRRRC